MWQLPAEALEHPEDYLQGLQDIADANPKSFHALFNLGLCQYRSGQQTAAVDSFRRAAALNNRTPVLRVLRQAEKGAPLEVAFN